MQAKLDLFKLGLGGVGEQGILGRRETDESLVGQLEPDATAFYPAA